MKTEQLTRKEIQELAERGFADPPWFFRFFLTKWFPTEIPWVHRGLIAILVRRCDFLEKYGEVDKIINNFVWREDPQDENSPIHHIFWRDEKGILNMTLGKFTLVLMPRGFSKTTIANAVNILNIVYKECKYPLYTSETSRHATKQLSNVTKQLTQNPRIKMVFGEFRPSQRNELGLKWSESDGYIQTLTGVTMSAVGRGGQVRGTLDDGQRPDRLIIDDVEDKESVATPEQRSKAHDWFYGDLLPAMPELDDDATAVMLATLLHFDALAVKVSTDPEWTTINIGVLDVDGAPIWPMMMDEEKIEKRKRRYVIQGLLHVFYLEYFNTIRASENAKFKQEFFHINPLKAEKTGRRALACDPAISAKKEASLCSFAVIEMLDNGLIHVWEAFGRVGMSPREQVDMYFALHFKYGMDSSDAHGVEGIAYQRALIHLIQEEQFRKGKEHGASAYFEVTSIPAPGEKFTRVEGILQPRYAAGYIHHQRHFPQLETALLDWPNGKQDVPDVVSMAVTLLDDAAFMAAGDEDLSKDEFEPIDVVMGGDWRQF